MSRIYVAVDLETTGFAADRDAILEIGAVKFRIPAHPDDDPIIDRWSTLVNPGRPIPYRITRLTSITQADVEHAPRLPQVLDELRRFVSNYPVVGHNVAFELSFLQRHDVLVGQAHLDTFELSSILLPGAPRYSLGELASYLGLEFDGWHRALADAEMTATLFLALWQRACDLPCETLDAIARVAMDSRWPLRSFFAAARRAQQAAGGPTAPRAPRPLPAIEPLHLHPDPDPLPKEEIAGLLAPEGRLSRAMASYEPRAEQVAMLNAVTRAFDRPSHLIVEAGTGTGKSLAYLIAAIYQATTRGERVVISTNTLNLQDQLFQELPFLQETLGRPFRVARLKGQSNYLCPRRVELLRRRGNFSQSEARLLTRVLVWLDRTEEGDRTTLNIQPDEEPVWEQISADSSSCRVDRCAPYGPCYWQLARAAAEGAHLLIVNHALLMADLEAGGGLIPPYHYLIIDEAHHLEEQATQQFGFVLSREQLCRTLERIGHEQDGRAGGLLARIRQEARETTGRQPKGVAEQCGLLLREVEQSLRAADELFESLDEILRSRGRPEQRQRLLPEWRQWAEWRRVERSAQTLCQLIEGLIEGLGRIEQALRPLSFDEPLWEDPADACQRTMGTLDTMKRELDRILLHPDPDDILWIKIQQVDEEEEEEGPPQMTLYRSPINVASLLHERLFEQKRSVVLTSATLSSEGSFSFLRERLGIDEAEELSLGSPYDFSRQALVYVANDLPEPNQPHYSTSLHRALIDLARATEGRMLVLFTSKSQLRAAYRAISDPLANDDIVVLGQYMDGSRTQLIERFRTIDRAVLLGTHSFWEGVDVPGPALSCLVITRLPFPVPTDPVQAARSQAYQNAFLDYAVPQAVIRFRQGFGRLLRTTSDRGVVALLDSRLDSKRYGRTFLNSLPPTNLQVGPFRSLPPLAARWLKEHGG